MLQTEVQEREAAAQALQEVEDELERATQRNPEEEREPVPVPKNISSVKISDIKAHMNMAASTPQARHEWTRVRVRTEKV